MRNVGGIYNPPFKSRMTIVLSGRAVRGHYNTGISGSHMGIRGERMGSSLKMINLILYWLLSLTVYKINNLTGG